MTPRRKPLEISDPCVEEERELRLVEAEKRANVLVVTAEWLHNIVAKRDAVNHWQESVNELFLGGAS